MDAREYQRLAIRTAAPTADHIQSLVNAALGLCGEAGEFADTIKKVQFQGHALDHHTLIKELGDVLWYVALACEALGVGMDGIMEANIAKLRQRYPDGFSAECSINRVEGR
jgi:NTP pyrophosphatase (non-canonical NTP hydrolase)